MGRCQAVKRLESESWGFYEVWRIVETSGWPVTCWLPGIEDDEGEPIDKGGFESKHDAELFALGVCWERAYHGLLPGMTTADVDAERAKYDTGRVSALDSIRIDDGPPSPLSAPQRPPPVYVYHGPPLAL